jgi:adenosylcobinamide-phosphate synthase
MYPSATEFIVGAAVDLVLGDPRWMPHPVRWMGAVIDWLERVCSSVFGLRHRRLAGVVLVTAALGISVGAAVLLLWVVEGAVRFIVVCYIVSSLLALASLDREALGVLWALNERNLDLARARLAGIVGRETRDLDEPEILRAVMETVAENLSDGVVAPVVFLMLGGVPGMVAYKCINTLDSMVGYKNERYAEFGWAAARLDDVVNYVPARLSALLVMGVAAFCGLSWAAGWRIVRRDAARHPSPNAGYPEAAVAGVLGVRLGGANRYFGKTVDKPYLGDPIIPLSQGQYPQLRRLLYGSALALYAVAFAQFYWMGAHA